MKHEPETTTLGEVIDLISRREGQQWYDVMGVEIPGLSESIELAKLSDDQVDWDQANDIEFEFVKANRKGEVTVFWPEHCLTKKYDGDATYHFTAIAPEHFRGSAAGMET